MKVRHLVRLVLVGGLVVGCTTLPTSPRNLPGTPLPAYPSIIPSATFLCGGGKFVPSLVGRLHGDSQDPQLVWLVADSGTRIDILWPPGFSVRFEPRLELLDDAGQLVGISGQEIDINTNPSSHAGTAEDPFPANHFDGRCYAPIRA